MFENIQITVKYLLKYINVNEKSYVSVDASIARMYSFKIIELLLTHIIFNT